MLKSWETLAKYKVMLTVILKGNRVIFWRLGKEAPNPDLGLTQQPYGIRRRSLL